jgi:hypothetical protein
LADVIERKSMNLKSVVVAVGLALAGLTLTPFAVAQSAGADKASAEALFNEGVSLVAAGNFAEGCRKFEGSQALETTLGTVLRLADCYERLGKVASAWATFKQAQGLARVQSQSEREELARQRVEALAPKLAYLRIALEGTAPPGLVVQRNGRALPLASLGVAIPVDPGEQQLVVSAPEHEPWERTITIAPGPGQADLSIPPLVASPTPFAPTRRSTNRRAPARSSTQRTAGIVVGAVGLASVLAGSVFGIIAKQDGDRSKRDEFCPTDDGNGCTQAGLDLRERARGFGTASTVTFIAGAALVTSGIVLFSTAPSAAEPTRARLQLRAGGGGFDSFGTTLRGTW